MAGDKGSCITKDFLGTARKYPHNILFHTSNERWRTVTYSEFSKAVYSAASALMSHGLKKGARVAILSENRPEWCAVYLSIVIAGGIAVPLDTQLGPEEIANLLYDSESALVFCSGKTVAHVSAAAAGLLKDENFAVRVISFDTAEYGAFLTTAPFDSFPEGSAEETASIIYTSGTTGKPKGVILTHGNFCSDARALMDAGVVTHEDNVLSVLPLHHTYAFMCTFLVPLLLGASITYPASLKGPDLMSAVNERGVTVIIAVPQLLFMIRNSIMEKVRKMPAPLPFLLTKAHRVSRWLREKADINVGRLVFSSAHRAFGERFRFFASGGARLDPAVMKDLEALGFTVLEGYGLTETAPVITFNPFSKRKPGSAGRPLPSVEIRTVNTSPGGEGEIAVRGPMVMKGYYRNPEATADVVKEGWLMTGDIGRLDNDGYLFITGRSKEVIVLSSGKNIYPEDVEKLYIASPLIKEICVVGSGRKDAAETLRALIVPDLEYAKKEGISNIQDALKWEVNEISSRMPSYMRVTGFSVRSEPFPRTPLGKLRRFMITEEAVKERPKETMEEEKFTDEVSVKVAALLEEYVKEGQSVSAKDNLELDIGLDSLSKIELVVELEKIFSVRLPEDFIADVQTVGDLIEKIRSRSAGGHGVERGEKAGWKKILEAEPLEKDLGTLSRETPLITLMSAFLIHTFLRLLFRIFFRLEARGAENIPRSGNYILTPNHTSYLDGFLVILALPFSYFRRTYSLGLSEFFTGFLKSGFARLAHVIPIDSSLYLNKALQMSAYVLKKGYSLSIFPEGGRSFDGSLLEFKKGVGILAVEIGTPVVPVYIDGAFEALPRGAAFPRCRKITVTFGNPLGPSDPALAKAQGEEDEYQRFADLLRERVRELM